MAPLAPCTTLALVSLARTRVACSGHILDILSADESWENVPNVTAEYSMEMGTRKSSGARPLGTSSKYPTPWTR